MGDDIGEVIGTGNTCTTMHTWTWDATHRRLAAMVYILEAIRPPVQVAARHGEGIRVLHSMREHYLDLAGFCETPAALRVDNSEESQYISPILDDQQDWAANSMEWLQTMEDMLVGP
jgi:hypothetical protein